MNRDYTPKLSAIFCGYRLTNREERRKARDAIRRGIEPQDKYYATKHWQD
jgi:hypothetical protein